MPLSVPAGIAEPAYEPSPAAARAPVRLPDGRPRHWERAAAVLPFLVLAVLTFATSVDDPLITLRYAWNLLHHGQPVFNLGERVEGFTSPLHLLVAAFVLLLPGGVALFKLKLLSLAFAAAGVWKTGELAQAAGLSRWSRLLAILAVAGSWNFVASGSNGLETSLVAFLATGTAASLARGEALTRWRRPAAWGALLALARPEAVLMVALLGALTLIHGRSSSSARRRARWLLGPALVVGALEVFRLAYYGAAVPNTYYAKRLDPHVAITGGFSYLLHAQPLAFAGVVLAASVLVLEAWLAVIGTVSHPYRRRLLYPGAIVLAQVIFILDSGGDWMPNGRFVVPALPALAVLLYGGLETLLAKERSHGRSIRWAATALLTLALVSPVSLNAVAPAWRITGLSDHGLVASGQTPLSSIWARATSLADCLSAGQSVAYSEVGLFGYEHPDLRVIDTRGLTSRAIARAAPSSMLRPSGLSDPDWFTQGSFLGRILIAERPAMIISFDAPRGVLPGSILDGLYRRAAVIPEPADGRTLFVYLRHGLVCRSI